MKQDADFRKLSLFLRIWSVACILIMSVNWTAFIFKLVSFNPGGPLSFMIWDDVYGHVGPMIFVIYIVWSIYLYKASYHLEKYRTFLQFSMWANVAHALVMVPMAISETMYHSKFLTDIPFISVVAIAIYAWLPSASGHVNTAFNER